MSLFHDITLWDAIIGIIGFVFPALFWGTVLVLWLNRPRDEYGGK